jgi:MFS family permease
LAVPALWRLLRQERTPQSMSEENTSLGMKGKHWSRIEALRHPLFWFMFPAILGQSAFNTAFFFHQVHFAQTKGWDHFLLVSFFPVYTGISVLMMLLSGWALDRFGTARIIPFFQVPMVVAFLCFAIGDGVLMFVLGLIFLSMTSGATATLPNAFWAEFYGTGSLGSIKALAAAVSVLGSAMGPGITGFLIDQGVELEMQYFWIAGFFAICVVALYVGVARSKPQLVLSPAPSI